MDKNKKETQTHTWKGKTQEVAYWKGMKWDKPLTEEMKRMEKETGQKAVWRGEITGTFEYWKYWKEYHESIKKPRGFQKGHVVYKGKKKDNTGKTDEELLEEAIEKYKKKYKVKTVNVKSKKFQRFYREFLK